MAGAIYGSGFLELSPKLADGFEARLNSQMSRVTASMARAGGDAGEAFGEQFDRNIRADFSKLASFAKTGALAIAGIGTAIAGLTIRGGLSRALNIEDAQAKLRGLGHDMESVEGIMESALDSVKGTAFGLDAAATAAASAVAAGIEPGEELTRVLSLTADAATIMGRDFNEAGAIVNKILASNRVSMEEVNQLHDAGLPILSQLADQYGVNAQAMREMVTQGVVDSETFLDALETNIAGAALASGETTRGALANVGAALSRLGESVVSSFLPLARTAFGGLIEGIDDLTARVKPAMEDFANSEFFATLQGHFERIPEYIDTAITAITDFWQATEFARDFVGSAISGLATVIDSQMGRAAIAIGGVRVALNALKAHPLIAVASAVGFVVDKVVDYGNAINEPIDKTKELVDTLSAAERERIFRAVFTEEELRDLENFLARSGRSISDYMGTIEDFNQLVIITGHRPTQVWAELEDAIGTATDRAGGKIEGLGFAMRGGFETAEEFAARTAEAREEIIELGDATSGTAQSMEDALAGIQEAAGERFEEITAAVDDFITGFEELPERSDITMDQFITNLEERSAEIAGFYENLRILIASGFDDLARDLEAQGPEAAAGLAEGFVNNIDQASRAEDLLEAAENLGMTVADNLVTEQTIQDAINAGRDIAAGLRDGINASAYLVANAAAEMMDQALQRGRAEIQAFSPSRKWRDLVGKPIGEGIAVGITESSGLVDDAVSRLVAPPTTGLTSSITPTAGSGVSGGVVFEEGAIQVNNPAPEPASDSLASPYLAAAVSSYIN